jgi:hypothetical protein
MSLNFIKAWRNDKWYNKRVLIWRFTLVLIKINYGQIGKYSIKCPMHTVACVGLFGHLFWNKRSFWKHCQIISCHTCKLSAHDRWPTPNGNPVRIKVRVRFRVEVKIRVRIKVKIRVRIKVKIKVKVRVMIKVKVRVRVR